MDASLYIGLMSGTSLDGIDAALVEFGKNNSYQTLATHFEPFPEATREELQQLFTPGSNEIDRLGKQCRHLGTLFAKASMDLIKQAGFHPQDLAAIGSHGQTIRHRPELTPPFTLQIGDPNTIAQLTGITTIADFRRRDIAALGQGAPHAPGFHQAFFQSSTESRVIINIGGIANLTWLSPFNQCIGFDTGPGNGLMDAWCKKTLNKHYDDQGAWARSGSVNETLLNDLFSFSYFDAPPPKSTGKEEFTDNWLESALLPHQKEAPQNIQATLLELTVRSIQQAIHTHCPGTSSIYVCGGGAKNLYLMERIQQACGIPTTSTKTLGVDPEWVEAIAFAWLAKQTHQGLTGNLPSVTGAKQAVILGGIYPGANGF